MGQVLPRHGRQEVVVMVSVVTDPGAAGGWETQSQKWAVRQEGSADHLPLGLPREVRPQACVGRAGRARAGVVCTACSGLQLQLPVSLAVSEDRPRRCLCSPALHVLGGGEGLGRGWGSSYILSYAHILSLFLLQGVNDHLSTEKGQPLFGAGGGWSAFPAFKETSYTPTVCQ